MQFIKYYIVKNAPNSEVYSKLLLENCINDIKSDKDNLESSDETKL